MPSAEAVAAVGKIARDLKYNAVTKPGSFFWGELGIARSLTVADPGQCWTQ